MVLCMQATVKTCHLLGQIWLQKLGDLYYKFKYVSLALIDLIEEDSIIKKRQVSSTHTHKKITRNPKLSYVVLSFFVGFQVQC